MRFRHRLKILMFRRGPSQKCVHALTLAAFVGTVVGFPLPTATPEKDRSRPFPCQDRPCGCRSAEQCWRGCCCFTMQQKLAWAKEHGVEPPAFVQAVVRQEALALCQRPKGDDCQHCTKSHSPEPCPSETVGERHACSHSAKTRSKNTTCHPTAATAQHRGSSGWRMVIGAAAARCQGIALLWSVLGGSLPPPEVVVWNFDWRLATTLESAPCTYLSSRLAPPVPPPRSLASLS